VSGAVAPITILLFTMRFSLPPRGQTYVLIFRAADGIL
jgi:hypothetical protein